MRILSIFTAMTATTRGIGLAARIAPAVVASLLPLLPAVADTDPPLFDEGRLLATGGVSTVEGSAGAGLTNWAVITGYGSDHGLSVNAHYTFVPLPDFTLHTAGVAVGLYNRLELSYARDLFDTGDTGADLGLGRGFLFREDVFGAKVRLAGDLVYDQDSWLPQIAAGLQYKTNDRAAIIKAVGGRSDSGTDFYLAATKLLLSESLLIDTTIRFTRANQFGILGFGGDRNDDYQAEFEGTAALLLSRHLAIGADFRTKPSNLGFSREQNAADAFIAYFIDKHISLTLAGVALGEIATKTDQNGGYLSIQVGY